MLHFAFSMQITRHAIQDEGNRASCSISTVTCSVVGTQPVLLGCNPNPAQVQTFRVPAGEQGRGAGRASTVFRLLPEQRFGSLTGFASARRDDNSLDEALRSNPYHAPTGAWDGTAGILKNPRRCYSLLTHDMKGGRWL
jgi:hypothetical protein